MNYQIIPITIAHLDQVAELEKICFPGDPWSRRQGIASALLDAFRRYGQEHGLDSLFLDVRPSNREALALYEKLGYREVGRRKNYYLVPKEDAMIMKLELTSCI